MIVYDANSNPPVEQGSEEWIRLHMGIPTASGFEKFLTEKGELRRAKKGGGMAQGANTYLMHKLVEHFFGCPYDATATDWMERGKEQEGPGIRWYSVDQDVDVKRIAFVTMDDGMVGCSPDFLVGDDGGGEVKAWGAPHHFDVLLNGSDEAELQSQAPMWLMGRKWWDRVFFHPTQPKRIIRSWRNDALIASMEIGVAEFAARMLDARERLEALGCVRNANRCPATNIDLRACRCQTCHPKPVAEPPPFDPAVLFDPDRL